jgi:hypothetical protein
MIFKKILILKVRYVIQVKISKNIPIKSQNNVYVKQGKLNII